jgi:hypothetical protein
MAHVFFSAFNYHDGDSTDEFYNPHTGTDNLFYWNESMGEDSSTTWDPNTGGNGRTYVAVAAAEDFNGNGQIDVPVDTFTNCTPGNPWGNYQGGITQMPSMGIDQDGNIYVSYQTIDELSDTTTWHMVHRHMYVMKLFAVNPNGGGAYETSSLTHPYNIIVNAANGGAGEDEETVFGAMARKVDNVANTAYVLYQADQVPGHSLATAGTCEAVKNLNLQNQIRVCKVDVSRLGIGVDELTPNDVRVSQNFPNPASDVTSITVGLQKAADLQIDIYNLLGKSVFHQSKGKVAAGTHTINLNTSAFASGIYTYTVTTGDLKTTRKMVIE